MVKIKIQGRIFLQGTIKAITGLHIGGSASDLGIGGNENPIIRNPLNRLPYIPGSSLRGKMRSLLDRHLGNLLKKQGNVQVHECWEVEAYKNCPVCQVFGITPQRIKENTMPARLIVRDTFLSCESKEKLEDVDTDADYTEIKTEVSIDRITSAANPRPIERVPADATFDPMRLTFSLYTRDNASQDQLQNELNFFDTVLKGMELLEDDYLGGSGSRGSGQIAFENLTMTFKSRECYEDPDTNPISINLPENADIKAVRQSKYVEQIRNAIPTE